MRLSRRRQVSSFAQVPRLLSLARSQLGESLSAFEFMDRASVRAVRRDAPHLLHRYCCCFSLATRPVF